MKILKVKEWRDIPKNFTGITEYEDGDKCWYQNGMRHRENGPAFECYSGTKFWIQNDKLHRLDGPATEYANGEKKYWISNIELTENQFQIFQCLWRETLLERTDELIEIFIELAKMR